MEMASKAADSSSVPRTPIEKIMEKGYESLVFKIRQLKTEVEEGRRMQVKEKLIQNGNKLRSHTHKLWSAACMVNSSVDNNTIEVPGFEKALSVLDGFHSGSDDKDSASVHETISSNSIMLPKVQRIPPFITWVFLDRNQRMAEEQSVAGRKLIYYDQSGNEALICSDSEDDLADIEEEKREYSDGEDRIILMAFQEHGLNDVVADVVCHFIGGTSSKIMERYNELKLKLETSNAQGSTERNVLLEKSLSGALDSIDNLFCRRCLVFDCRLHGCYQTIVYPSEKPVGGLESEDRKPCSDQCYLVAGQPADDSVEISNVSSLHQMETVVIGGENSCPNGISPKNNIGRDNADKVSSLEPEGVKDSTLGRHTIAGKRKMFDDNGGQLQITDSIKDSFDKKQKKVLGAEAVKGSTLGRHTIAGKRKMFDDNGGQLQITDSIKDSFQTKLKKILGLEDTSVPREIVIIDLDSDEETSLHDFGDDSSVISERLALEQTTTFGARRKGLSRCSEWKPLEKDLYAKGLEIFGRNSCLIARNLLSGLRTCTEVFNYMRNNGAVNPVKTLNSSSVRCLEDHAQAVTDDTEQDILLRRRSRIFRKRGRARRVKYVAKSNGHPSSWKRIGNGIQRKQYSPCTCQSMCGKDCPCLKIGACCEKYCGCSKTCKNRFRGCHCAKSQCRSRQCPCFAANRECDPDVCRNCWVSCGGGSLGEPLKKGEGQCGNMQLLLRQHKRVLLGRSDLTGWGAFIKDTVNKQDYLGEYTGELISNREADKRGKIYDRKNSSFLFDLNDQYVLDACRYGDKLKFANHSSKPNCFCKVMLVGGDHRVGIFAKERIEAQEEIFYDYCYDPDATPEWARRPESSKKDDSLASQSRPRKHQSRS